MDGAAPADGIAAPWQAAGTDTSQAHGGQATAPLAVFLAVAVLLAGAGATAGAIVIAVGMPRADRTVAAVLAAGWLAAVAGAAVSRAPRPAIQAALVAGLHACAARWPALAPPLLAGWLWLVLALPAGRLGDLPRQAVAGLGVAAATGWTVSVAAGANDPTPAALTAVGGAAAAVAVAGVATRYRRSGARDRRLLQWAGAGAVVALAAAGVAVVLHALLSWPRHPAPIAAAALVAFPVALATARIRRGAAGAEQAVVGAVVSAGLAVFVGAVYLVVVIGFGHAPSGADRDVLGQSVVAALVCAVLALPVQARLKDAASRLVRGHAPLPDEVLTTFDARMTRAVPLDELLLQLAESLREAMGLSAAEVWVGVDGFLTRTVSVPERPAARIALGERARTVAGRTRVTGNAWLAVWAPDLLAPPADADAAAGSAVAGGAPAGDHAAPDLPTPDSGHDTGPQPTVPGDRSMELVRVAPTAHHGELLGLLVVRRPPDAAPFTGEDDRVLGELARRIGLALHNVNLDAALQASFAELRRRNAELTASRARVVAAADASRRQIERNLHDGAQQHLVSLAVRLGLARQVLDTDPLAVAAMLDELRGEVRTTIAELRELAHGIYPPLLRDRGLAEALRAAANRSALPCDVQVELAERYPEEAETAVYFCCLEALHNAGKHAGAEATVALRVAADAAGLHFSVRDTGRGFALAAPSGGRAARGPGGHGFVNMTDRLGAIGGELTVESAPGRGTLVRGAVPAQPRCP